MRQNGQHNHAGCSVVADLSDKQKLFVERYLISLNATKAAKEAGYSEKTAYRIGFENLKKPQIAELIEQKRNEAQKRNEVSLDEILREYKRIAFTGMSRFIKINDDGEPVVDLSDCTPEDLDLLTETRLEAFNENNGQRQVYRVKIKTMDRLKALETLGKHLGLGEKSKEDTQDRLTLALIEISKRGSVAPIATARRREQG